MHLPAPMEMFSKLELFCPELVMSTINRPGVKDLPVNFFACLLDPSEEMVYQLASHAIYVFLLEVEAFQDARKKSVFQRYSTGCHQIANSSSIKGLC